MRPACPTARSRKVHPPRPVAPLLTPHTATQGCFREPARRCGKPHLSPRDRVDGMRAPLRPARSRPHASDAVSGHGVRRIARDGSLQQPCFAVLRDARRSATCAAWATGSAGGANNRSRRESVSGQNAEATRSAGPSLVRAPGSDNRRRRRVFRAPSFVFAEPALPVGHAGMRERSRRVELGRAKQRLLLSVGGYSCIV